MLAIQIGDEFINLPPQVSLDLVEENPFLQFAEDQTVGNYSLPFELSADDPNIRLTSFVAIIQKIVDNDGIEARLYSNGMQHSFGRIKVEKSIHNLNNLRAGKLNCFYLFGSTDFYQGIKDKSLRLIDVGGDRSFAWDAYDGTGVGFWNHVTTLMRSAPNTDDYAFFPVINKGWPSGHIPGSFEIMNDMAFSGGQIIVRAWVSNGSNLDLTRYIPYPYLHYVLRQCFAYAGWTVDGDIMDDDTFKKITLVNAQAINWGYVYKSGGLWFISHSDPVVFNLQDNLPDIKIGEFLVAIRKRFGLWYNFDYANKNVTVSQLDDLTDGVVKDVTTYASPVVTKNIDQEKKIYALRNHFAIDGGDSPDLTNVLFQGNVDELTDLPAADQSLNAQVYLVVVENNYYICLQNETTEAWEWELFSYNIFDHAPAGANLNIDTDATTIGMEAYARPGGDPQPGFPLLPRLDINGRWFGRTDSSTEEEWGIHLCFYHGPVNRVIATGTYPYGSSHIYDPSLNQVADWGLPFHCYKIDDTDVGLYKIFWEAFLTLMSGVENMEATLYLPIVDFLKLAFSDRLVITGVMMFLKQKKSSLEYKNQVDIEAVRVL